MRSLRRSTARSSNKVGRSAGRRSTPRLRVASIVAGIGTLAALCVSPFSTSVAEASAVGGTISRSEVISRDNWLSRAGSITYDSSRRSNTLVSDVDGAHRYGPDCSGLVSMAWHLSPSGGGLSTRTLDSPSVTTAISKASLKPGDLLLYPDHHAVLFDYWHADGTHFSYFNLGSRANGMRHYDNGSFASGASFGGHPANVYVAYRYKNIVDDAPPPPPPATHRHIEITSIGDLNRDGIRDMLSVQSGVAGGTLLFWAYRGAGPGFDNPISLGTNWDSMRELMGLGVKAGNEFPDLLAIDKSTGQLWLYPGEDGDYLGTRRLVGTGGWGPMNNLTPMGNLDGAGDPYPDFVTIDSSTGVLYLYKGGEDYGSRTQVGTNWNTMSSLVSLGDFDGDGQNDIAAVENSTGKLWLYPGRGYNGFGTRVLIGNGGWNAMREIEGAGDMDGDGHPDLTAVDANGMMWLYPGTGSGAFGDRKQVLGGWNG